jgi:hypothetical protein
MATFDTVGEIVTWKSPTEIKFSDLKQALAAAGLKESLARDMLPRNAFSRACRELEKNRIIKQIKEKETEKELVFQFTGEYLSDTDGEYHYSKECDLTVSKITGKVLCAITNLQDRAQVLLDNEMSVRRSSDVTRIVQKIFDEYEGDLVTLRERGGCYFVPDRHRDLATMVETFLSHVGGHLRRFSTNSQQSTGFALKEHIENLLQKFRKSCEDITSDTSDSITGRRVASLAAIRGKVEAYHGILGFHMEEIEREIEASNKMLRTRINSMAAESEGSPVHVSTESEPVPVV